MEFAMHTSGLSTVIWPAPRLRSVDCRFAARPGAPGGYGHQADGTAPTPANGGAETRQDVARRIASEVPVARPASTHSDPCRTRMCLDEPAVRPGDRPQDTPGRGRHRLPRSRRTTGGVRALVDLRTEGACQKRPRRRPHRTSAPWCFATGTGTGCIAVRARPTRRPSPGR